MCSKQRIYRFAFKRFSARRQRAFRWIQLNFDWFSIVIKNVLSLFLLFTLLFINIHIFAYPDSRLSGLFTEVPTSPDNRGSTVSTYVLVLQVHWISRSWTFERRDLADFRRDLADFWCCCWFPIDSNPTSSPTHKMKIYKWIGPRLKGTRLYQVITVSLPSFLFENYNFAFFRD